MAYFSNSTEGEILDRQCNECPVRDEDPCPILLVQLMHNDDQCDNEKLKEAMTTLVDGNGACMMKPLIEKIGG